mmetsp:Transcript_1843/g.3062  ORF Transcript_1843/g.3062 Transcript_1843/m.3062 type:complete len:223 (-) Transcript_1843:49-717(-)|eukprot:CAMPEP_0181031640 /NCGR_PEP_ID=MMETSP1070-20121207/6337_1 /TAXON_ID=265543 /ORGANISM="Minutocellus polymorphus, Strain NH13" /LENGTH=222 /DNA_ID=CAMNT_0023109025 /DNA_START=41 /DNA_END=709 /DNA_ORIENTATION=-
MRIISKLFLAGLALAATPAKACDSTLDIVLDLSGATGFDNNGNDFDILRELVVLTGLQEALGKPKDGGLRRVTVFAPRDDAFIRLADQLSDLVDGDFNSDDEEEAFTYIAGVLTTIAGDLGTDLKMLVTSILQYHIGNKPIVFMDEARKGKKKHMVTTLYDKMMIEVEMAMPTDNNNMRMKMIHEADGQSFRYPKIHNTLYDIETCNGRLNVLKDVLIPLDV